MTIQFHSIAYYLKDETEHFYHYHLGMQEAIKALNIPFNAHIRREASLSTLPHNWHKTFHGFHNRASRRKFFKDCIELFRKKEKTARIFFLEFFDRRNFTLFALSALLFGKKQDSLWILYRHDLTLGRKREPIMIRLFSQLLQLKFRKRFTPLTDSEKLVPYYQHWFTKTMTVLPIMHTQYQEIVPLSKRKQRIILSWPGVPRPEKGLKEIQQLVQLADPQSKRFTLELAGATSFPAVTNELKITLQKMQLSQEEYFNNLNRADVIVLPYDAFKYKWRTSGIFVEAVAAGKLPLVKQGSWLAEELKRYQLDELIVDFSAPLFFTHLYELIYNVIVQEKFAKMQAHYKTVHCKENFNKKLKELFCHNC